jgi:predicted GNAT family acetyltransferase
MSEDAPRPRDALAPRDAAAPREAPGRRDALAPRDAAAPRDAPAPREAPGRRDALAPREAPGRRDALAPRDDEGTAIEIRDAMDASRYEARAGGALTGWVDYRRMGRRLVAIHTEVAPQFGGRGIAGALIRRVIADARAAGTQISPLCPLFQAHFRRHPEDRDVLAPGRLPPGG